MFSTVSCGPMSLVFIISRLVLMVSNVAKSILLNLEQANNYKNGPKGQWTSVVGSSMDGGVIPLPGGLLRGL